MFSKLRPIKSLSISKKQGDKKSKSKISNNKKYIQKHNQDQNQSKVLAQYGKQNMIQHQTNQPGNYKQSKMKQTKKYIDNIYYFTSTTCASSSQQQNTKTSRKQYKFRPTNIKTENNSNQKRNNSECSSPNSISSIGWKELQNNYQSVYNKGSRKILKNKSNKMLSLKQISTKTSIKQIESCELSPRLQKRSKGQNNRSQQQLQTQKVQDIVAMFKRRQKTLNLTIKSLIKQLKQVKKQNQQTNQQLLKIKSKQFYVLDHEKVSNLVQQLDEEKTLRNKILKEKQNLLQQKRTIKHENFRLERQNKQLNVKYIELLNQMQEVKQNYGTLQKQNFRLKNQMIRFNSTKSPSSNNKRLLNK